MEEQEFLLGIAQVAVTLAGFSGLVVAIRGAPPSDWHARDIWSLSWMFGTSFGALFLALLPLVLRWFHLRDDRIWIIASLVMSLSVVLFSAAMVSWGHRLTKSGHPPRVRIFPTLARLLLVLSATLAGAGALGVFPRLRIGFFMLGLVTCLLVAALSLVVFLVVLARAAAGGARLGKPPI
jgi:hypothetical protein